MRLAVAAIAAVLLIGLDYMIVAASFLGEPRPGEIMLIALALVMAVAVWLRRRWIVFLMQSAVAVLMLARLVQSLGSSIQVNSSMSPAMGYVAFAVQLALGYVLAWLIARAIPRRENRT